MKFLSQINVNTEYTLPFVDGNNGQVLTTDGQGAVYWGNVSAGATSLDGLTDVEITSPQAGQILNYSVPLGGTVPVWRNITSPYATIASPAFTGIPTAPTAPTGTDSTQIATTAFVKAQGYLSSASSINDLSDVTISTATTGQILQWSGTQWVNATLSTVEYVSKVQHLVKCGVAVTKGQAVYVTTSDGTNMIVGLASNASEPTSSKVIGLAASTGAINDQIFVVTEGLIAGLNTSTATAGDPVWLGTGGNLIFGLANKPVAPAHLVYLGVVTRVQANNGEIFVNVQNGFELNELHDVLISSPSAGQLIRRDSDGLWKNWSPNFLTAEADTLQTVTTRGASTSLAISANGVTSPNFTSTALMIINADSSGSLQPDQGSPANKILSFRWQGLEGGYIDTNNVITFAGFKTSTGTASQFLKANGTIDSNTYLTTTTAAATYATFGYVDDEITAVNTYVQDYFVPKTRTLTINGTSYDLSANRSWTITTADSTKVSKSGESHDTVEPNNLGAGDGGFYTVKNGFGPSGGNDALIHIPYSNSVWAHQLAFDWALGNDQDMWFRTKNSGTWQGWRKVWHDGNFTDNSANWNTAYNDRITSAAVTGTSTKTLTLTQGDGGTVTATWTDYDTDNDAQTLTYDQGAKEITISNGNSITLDNLATEDYVNSQGFITGYTETDPIYTSERDALLLNKTVHPTLLFSTLADYNKPSGYSTMIQPSSYQNPLPSHGYYHIIARRDTGGGYGALLQSYNSHELYHGNTTASTTNISWYKIWNSGDFSAATVTNWNTAYGWGNHAGLYIPINPDGDGPSWAYSDENPTINGTYIGGRQSFGADGDALTGGALQARLLNAYEGHVNSTYGYYVGNLNYGGDSGTHTTTQVINASGTFVGPSVNTSSVVVTASEGREVQTYMPSSYTTDDLVAGHEYGWYSDHWRLGMTRSGATPGADFVVQWNGARRLSLTNGGNLTATGNIYATGGNSTQWNAAYGWGNHADAPYWNVSLNQDVQVEAQNVTFAGNVIIQGSLTESSSIRFKENIQPLELALAKVEQLNPVTYTKITSQEEEIGLIAEEVAELFPEVVTYNEEGQPQGIQYQRLSVILLKAVQELTERVNKLENK